MSSKGCRVYIGNLPKDCRERDIERAFKTFGRIRDILVKTGYGFVEFEDHRDADDAVYEMDGTDLLGERVSVEVARGTRRERSRDGRRNGSSRAPWLDKYGPPMRTKYRVIVENLSTRVSWQDLKDLMRRAGEVCYADAHKDKRNEGVIEFMSRRDLERAMEKYDGHEMNGRRIKMIEERRSRSRSRRSRSRSRPRRSRSRGGRRSRSRDRRSKSRDRRSRSHSHRSSRKDRKSSRSRSNSRRSGGHKSRSRSADSRRSRSGSNKKSSKSVKDEADNRSKSKSPTAGTDGSGRKRSAERNGHASGEEEDDKSKVAKRSRSASRHSQSRNSKSKSKSRSKSRSRSRSNADSKSRSVSRDKEANSGAEDEN